MNDSRLMFLMGRILMGTNNAKDAAQGIYNLV